MKTARIHDYNHSRRRRDGNFSDWPSEVRALSKTTAATRFAAIMIAEPLFAASRSFPSRLSTNCAGPSRIP